MIVSCPACSAQFRLDRQRLGGKRITLRCARCRDIFKVEIPNNSLTIDLRVLVGHSDPAICAAIGDVLAKDGIASQVCHDGAAALDLMEEQSPQVAVIDVALPGLYAFEVVDKIRNRPGLENVRIILLSSVYNRTAYKRCPSSLYGADDYIEKHHIPDHLVPKIHRLVSRMVNEPARPAAEDEPAGEDLVVGQEIPPPSPGFIEQTNARIRRAEEAEVDGTVPDEAVIKARRLARIIVSDIALYNQDLVEEGVRNGTFFELLDSDVAEGRRLYQDRVPAEVHQHGDLLQNEFIAFIERRRQELRI